MSYQIIRNPSTFFRIEKEDGRGHFSSRIAERLPYWELHAKNMDNLITEFSKVFFGYKNPTFDLCHSQAFVPWFCGYKSAQDLMKFNSPQCLRVLYQLGYRIHSITARYCIHFEKQIAFRKHFVQEKRSLSLKQFSQLLT